jgi:hypothetical protein
MAPKQKIQTFGLEVEKDGGVNKVLSVRPVKLAMVTYLNDKGDKVSSMALVGQNEVRLVNMRRFGLSKIDTEEGQVNDWFRNQILSMTNEGATK